MFLFTKTTATLILVAACAVGSTSVAQEHSLLAEPIYQDPAYQEPAYEGPTYESSDYQEPPYEGPVYESPLQPEMIYNEDIYEPVGQPVLVDDTYGLTAVEPIFESRGDSYCGSYSDGSLALNPGCGMEMIGTSVLPAIQCNCGPVCGCDVGYDVPTGGVFEQGIGLGQSIQHVIGDTSQCDPCAGNTYRPGLLTWANDFCVQNGFAIDSFLVGGGGYFSIDYGIAMTNDRAEAFGTFADSIGGLPSFDLHEGGLSRYAIGMGSGNRRMELELGIRRNSFDGTKSGSGARSLDRFKADGYRRSTSLMLNGYRDFHNSSFWTPYLKAGVGISHNVARTSVLADINSPAAINALGLTGPARQDTDFPRSSTTQFAWAVGAGVATDLTERIKLDIDYQFLNAGVASTGRDSFGNAIDLGEGALHEVTVGLRFMR